jgi:hypothetical protein
MGTVQTSKVNKGLRVFGFYLTSPDRESRRGLSGTDLAS